MMPLTCPLGALPSRGVYYASGYKLDGCLSLDTRAICGAELRAKYSTVMSLFRLGVLIREEPLREADSFTRHYFCLLYRDQHERWSGVGGRYMACFTIQRDSFESVECPSTVRSN